MQRAYREPDWMSYAIVSLAILVGAASSYLTRERSVNDAIAIGSCLGAALALGMSLIHHRYGRRLYRGTVVIWIGGSLLAGLMAPLVHGADLRMALVAPAGIAAAAAWHRVAQWGLGTMRGQEIPPLWLPGWGGAVMRTGVMLAEIAVALLATMSVLTWIGIVLDARFLVGYLGTALVVRVLARGSTP